mmetsp:Transcript_7273/g.10668  ORF Transcript_7273/g.10668 Transcript_7273/m.10668 type:complete len:81 (+) Transcript_7273:104-346(+)
MRLVRAGQKQSSKTTHHCLAGLTEGAGEIRLRHRTLSKLARTSLARKKTMAHFRLAVNESRGVADVLVAVWMDSSFWYSG